MAVGEINQTRALDSVPVDRGPTENWKSKDHRIKRQQIMWQCSIGLEHTVHK